MSGPFESLDLEGLDDSLVCVDGVCAVPPQPSAERFDEQGSGAVAQGDAAGEGERPG